MLFVGHVPQGWFRGVPTMASMSAGDGVGVIAFANRARHGLGARWPKLRYLSLAFYSAWILLAVTSSEAVALLDGQTVGSLQGVLYLSSGIALTVCLVLAGVFSSSVQEVIEHGPLTCAMGLLASISTFVLIGGLGIKVGPGVFFACGIGTGVGTAFVCLRTGHVTSHLNGVEAALMVGLCALLANFVFFMCQVLPPVVSMWVISVLPLLASLCSFCTDADADLGPETDDLIDVKFLPKGYFLRLVCTVFVFALAAGVAKGIAALMWSDAMVLEAKQSTWEVFISFLAVLLFVVGIAVFATFKNVDLSRMYLPVGFATAAGMLLCPISGSFLPVQGIVVNVLYNIFILVVWCWLIELAGRTTLGSVRVFGFGRGASACATTLGWGLVMFVEKNADDPTSLYTIFFLVMAFALLVMMMLVLNERTVSEAFAKTVAHEMGLNVRTVESAQTDDTVVVEDPWSKACDGIASEFKLTPREAEVFALLSRGRSISYIAEEFVIAPSTVKGYTKNIYAKVGIHSRQELIDLTESRISAGH